MGVGAVRVAVPEDAPALGDVHVTCWREACAHLFSPPFLAALDVDDRGEQWARRLAGHGPVRELSGLYLLAAHHGTGLGQALLDGARKVEPSWEDLAEVRYTR